MDIQKIWYEKSALEVLEELKTTQQGLSIKEAKSRLSNFGPNKLPESKADSLFVIFIRQFQSPLIYILMVSALIVFFMGEVTDAIVIFAVLFFNATVGTIQEGKAQNTLLALKRFVETKATVLREGKELIIPDSEVVVGDLLILQEGEKIPADARIIESNSLKVDESALTGESEPVFKISQPLSSNLKEPDYKNIVFKGTNIVAGNGKAVVFATGSKTIIGKIASKIKGLDTEVPLKKSVSYLSKLIIAVVLSISVSLFFIGIVSGKSVVEMFATVVSLSVSIVPEGLPIVVTLVLAMGVWRMSKQNALVKKLQAVEALGHAQVIAVDKTGTITKNELVIRKVYVDGKIFDVDGDGYEPKGNVYLEGKIIDAVDYPEILLSAKIAAYCANAKVMYLEEQKIWRISGDPTEAAMLVFGQKIGFHKDQLEQENPVISEIPFDYRLKYHALVHGKGRKKILTVVGAPETILNLSSKIWRSGKNYKLSSGDRKTLEETFLKMSQEGLRVIAFAKSNKIPDKLSPESINNLTFVGFYGMQDTIRPEVAKAIQKATEAGIRVVMITGDHKVTAVAIAKKVGIYNDGDLVISGADIDQLSSEELSGKIEKVSVFARVNPDHKLSIIKAFRNKGKVIAMTGDGVNDVPSLVAADLGVAMGNIGTEVAKEAADIVLLDDNFENIVLAIEEGRSIYKTIKKVILYLFSTSLGEVMTIAGAIILGFPLPILPSQIIWLNFVTDGFLVVSLAMEPKERNLLSGSFKKSNKYLVDKLMAQRMIIMALPMVIFSIILFSYYYKVDITKSWTITLTLLAVFQWFNAWNCRSEEKSIFHLNPFSNKFLFGAIIVVFLLQLLAVYNPFFNKFLKTTPLSFYEWILVFVLALSIILVEEIRKFFQRRQLLK
jgi:Ca2+-transporting ATPase